MYIQSIKGLDLSRDFEQSKKEHARQERALRGYIKVIPGLVEKICREGKQIYDQIVLAIPGRNTDSILRQRRSEFMKRINEINGLSEFQSHIAGDENQKKVSRLICDIVSGQMSLKDGKKRLTSWATKLFKNVEIETNRSQFEGSGYDEKLINFLPPQVYFELGPNRELLSIKESFGREQKNWYIMSKKIAYIARHFNDIVREIKNDLQSGSESTRLLALMMAITIETGLRPGAVGNAANVIDPDTGEKIQIDTFGVTTLQPQHINIIREDFAQLEFVGKKGTMQIAQLTDEDVIRALKDVLNVMSSNSSTSMVFITKGGEHVDDTKMRQYVKDKWSDISPTDFRKYVATKSFYEYVRNATEEFRRKLSMEVANGQKIVQSEIIDRVIEIMNQGIESAKSILSHKEGHEAWQSYVSPKVIMAFLSNGGIRDTLEDILIDNKNVRFSFNFEDFVNFVEGDGQ